MQSEIVDHVIGGDSALVILPTGGGKSMCFQIPSLCMDGLTIVVSPLIRSDDGSGHCSQGAWCCSRMHPFWTIS